MNLRSRCVIGTALLAVVFRTSPAAADLVVLTSGRTLSVTSHRSEGDTIVLALRGGGEIACSRDLIDRIEQDEVPWPEEPASAAALPEVTRRPFHDLIAAAARRHDVPERLLESMIRVESNFAERARSQKGAMGLMQLMPATARQYAVANAFDPDANIDAGARHLRSLLDRYDLPLALAAYNAGEGAVIRYGGVPPFRETRSYVARVLRFARLTRPSKR